VSVLLVHHPRKGIYRPGQAARGSGALGGHVDTIMEMGWLGDEDNDDRRRWLRAYSRHEETRRYWIIELNPEGTDYLYYSGIPNDKTVDSFEVLRLVLEDAEKRFTQR
jgi:hypothetical protein